LIREAQLLTLRNVPKTGMAVAIDVGDAFGLRPSHPPYKKPVGERLALWALKNEYGRKDIVPSGPLYKSYEIQDDRIVIHFDYTNGGLMAKGNDGRLKGFAIAGNDHIWHWADAEIVGNTDVVHSSEVKEPAAVRYGWANVVICNLYNGYKLPASPFRTDRWLPEDSAEVK